MINTKYIKRHIQPPYLTKEEDKTLDKGKFILPRLDIVKVCKIGVLFWSFYNNKAYR